MATDTQQPRGNSKRVGDRRRGGRCQEQEKKSLRIRQETESEKGKEMD